MKRCLFCGKNIPNRNKYCNNKCQAEYEYLLFVENWKIGNNSGTKGHWGQLSNYIRRYMLEKNQYKCSICGWGEVNPYTNTIPLEIDHIDGDASNNREENLRVICPNCHSLTPSYRGANRGNGRPIIWKLK